MRRVWNSRAHADWAMLAPSCRAGEAPGEPPRRDPDDAAKMPVELALVVEANRLRGVRDKRTALKQLLRLRNPRVGQVLVGRQPDLGTKCTHQVELVEPGVGRQVVECDLVGQCVVKDGA